MEVKSLFGETVDKRLLPDFASITSDAEIQGLGKFFSDYFSDVDVSVTGKFNVADTIDVAGTFTFQKEVTPTNQIKIGASGVDALLGQNLNGAGEIGVKITGADLGLILKNGGVATDFSGSASLVGFSDGADYGSGGADALSVQHGRNSPAGIRHVPAWGTVHVGYSIWHQPRYPRAR